MDFNDSPEEAAYRAQVRAWLEANAPKAALTEFDMEGGGSMAASKAWQAKKAAAGYAQITWPKAWGEASGSAQPLHHRPWHVRAHRHGLRRRRHQAALRRPGPAGRGDLVPAVL
jgi:alkylation response protein AidB-like acyl-CoA dehydrogenase